MLELNDCNTEQGTLGNTDFSNVFFSVLGSVNEWFKAHDFITFFPGANAEINGNLEIRGNEKHASVNGKAIHKESGFHAGFDVHRNYKKSGKVEGKFEAGKKWEF